MKTKEQLLKIYSAYLPYSVKVSPIHFLNYGSSEGNGIGSLRHMLTTESNRYKLHLRPMEQLTQEIEHNGERFVPLVKLAEIEAGEHNCDEVDVSIEDEGYAFYIEYLPSWFGLYFNKDKCTFTRWDDGEGKDSCSNELRDKLLEWHFNIYGLDESEYIKKESLNPAE